MANSSRRSGFWGCPRSVSLGTEVEGPLEGESEEVERTRASEGGVISSTKPRTSFQSMKWSSFSVFLCCGSVLLVVATCDKTTVTVTQPPAAAGRTQSLRLPAALGRRSAIPKAARFLSLWESFRHKTRRWAVEHDAASFSPRERGTFQSHDNLWLQKEPLAL